MARRGIRSAAENEKRNFAHRIFLSVQKAPRCSVPRWVLTRHCASGGRLQGKQQFYEQHFDEGRFEWSGSAPQCFRVQGAAAMPGIRPVLLSRQSCSSELLPGSTALMGHLLLRGSLLLPRVRCFAQCTFIAVLLPLGGDTEEWRQKRG